MPGSSTVGTISGYSNGVLTIANGGATAASLHFSGSYALADFAASSDGHGGTVITFV